MKLIFKSFIVLFGFLLMSFNNDDGCIELFEGTWKYERYDVSEIYVKRTLDKQYEFMQDGEFYYEFDIEWINDCEYELTYLGTNSSIPAAIKKGEKLHIEIVEINDSIMKYITTFRDLKDSGKMEKIGNSTS